MEIKHYNSNLLKMKQRPRRVDLPHRIS